MNKIITALTTFLCILSANTAMAIPTYGTLMPRGGEYQGGGRADLVFDRDVKDYRDASSYTYQYTASYGFTDWFCVEGSIGLGDVVAEFDNMNKLRYPIKFSGGYGWRAKLYKNEKYGVDCVFGFQHVSTHPGARRQVLGRKHEIIWDEWQFSTTISKEVWRLRPYCGTKWSFIYLISKTDGDRHRRLSNDSPIGLVVGTDLRLNNYLYMNVEGRLFDEEALNAGFTVRF